MNKRLKTPTLIQMEAVECGAASLGIILGYFGAYISLEELRYECGVSRDGSNILNISRAAEKYGLDCKAYRIPSLDKIDMLFEMEHPIVVLWEMNHFLVVEGRKRNKVFLNDPTIGPRAVSIDEFKKSFSTFYMTFKLNENFRKTKKPVNILKGLLYRLKGAERSIVLSFLTSLLLVLPGICIPGLSKVFIDNYIVKKDYTYFIPVISFLALFMLISIILTWMQQVVIIKLGMKLLVSGSCNFMWHALKLPMTFFNQRSIGFILNCLQSNVSIAKLLSEKMAGAFFNLIQIVFFGIAMMLICWQLTCIVFLISMINIIIFYAVNNIRRNVGLRLQKAGSKLTGTIIIGNSMIESLKSSGAETDFFSRWSGFFVKYINIYQKNSLISMITEVVPSLCSYVSYAMILGIGCILTVQGKLSLGELIGYSMIAKLFSSPINNIVNFGSSLQEATVDIRCLDDVHNYNIDPKHLRKDSENKVEEKLSGSLEIKNLTFGYSRLSPPLIENFNLKLKPGSRVAIVGTTGSGKSTIANLTAGLYTPWEGEILFDDINIKDISPGILSCSLSMVSQNPFFFKGSIWENLTMWDNTIPDHEVTEATKKAKIYEEISLRDNVFESQIDENGSNFSGGQLQRLSIARAIINEPSILILDEATSALDPEIEERIDRNLRSLGCTVLIIAHRLSTIRDCDEIIVLSNGIVIERGTHDELITKNGLYSELIKTE